MTIQTEPKGPPFDGKPCPMCPMDVRNVSAVVHNFLWRWPDHDWQRKAYQIVQSRPADVQSDDPAVQRLLKAAAALVSAIEAQADIAPLIPELRAAHAAAEKLSDAHFSDPEHSHGDH